MLTEDQRMTMMYTGLASCFSTERRLAWSRSQLLTAINIASFPLFVTTTSIELRYILSFVGMVMSSFWYWIINKRSRARINYWQDCLARMEPAATYLLVFRVFTGSESKVISKRPLFYIVNLLPLMFIFIWSVAIVNIRVPGTIIWFFNLLRERGIL